MEINDETLNQLPDLAAASHSFSSSSITIAKEEEPIEGEYLKLLDDDSPVSQQVFEALKEAILSEDTEAPQASAIKIDSLLRANVGKTRRISEEEEEMTITADGFSCDLGMILTQTIKQIPIEEEKQHERLGKVIVRLTNITQEVKDGDRVFFWSDLPFIEGELEDQWHQISPGDTPNTNWRRFNLFVATLVGINANSASPSKQIQKWVRWGWYPLNFSLGGSRRHHHTQKISESPISGEYFKAWLETAAMWMEKAGNEIYRQSKGSRSEEGGGLLWAEALKEGNVKGDKWDFWKERVRIIGQFDGSDAEIKALVRKLEKAMEKAEQQSIQA